ncbi:hypothetical protein [Diplocloster hominis]|uniref:hypothetical protein n=1 Tax=Diplocloster hominis TaxID=3079010 RepID=UPI0031BB9FBA
MYNYISNSKSKLEYIPKKGIIYRGKNILTMSKTDDKIRKTGKRFPIFVPVFERDSFRNGGE